MTRYAKRKLKYSLNENFNLLPYVEWDRFVTLTGAQADEGYLIVSSCPCILSMSLVVYIVLLLLVVSPFLV